MEKTPFPFEQLGNRPSCARDGETLGQEENGAAEYASYCAHLTDFGLPQPSQEEGRESDPLFTAEDLMRAVDEAQRSTAIQVEAEIRSAMASDIENRRCEILASIKDEIVAQKSTFEGELARAADMSHRLAQAMVKAAIPRALEKQPLADISDVIRGTLARLVQEPSIEVRLPTVLAGEGEAIVADLAGDVGFTGDVKTIADPDLSVGDLELCWKGGGIDRRLDRLQAEALTLVDYWFQDRSPNATEDPPEATTPVPETGVSGDASEPSMTADKQAMP